MCKTLKTFDIEHDGQPSSSSLSVIIDTPRSRFGRRKRNVVTFENEETVFMDQECMNMKAGVSHAV